MTTRSPRAPLGAPTFTRSFDRRGFLGIALGAAAAAGLAACGGDDSGTAEAAPRPTGSPGSAATTTPGSVATTTATTAAGAQGFGSVPPGTGLRIGSSQGATPLALELSGLVDQLQFEVVEWANVAAGPDVINAFRADSLDVGINAGIPPIQAHFQDLGAKIVAVNLVRNPIYVFATKPGSDIATVADFAGKKLAFSQGQAQGVVLLRALRDAGLAYDEVELVPLTSNQFLTALQAGQVDIAPLGLSQVPQYLDQYARDGAKVIETDVVDLLAVLWAPDRVLADEAKSAALAAYIPLWAQSLVWTREHPDEWVEEYYVGTQNITAEQGREILDLTGPPEFPATWDEAIAWEQDTIDLLAAGGFVDSFDALEIFDRRFEGLASAAVPAKYQGKA